MEESASQTLKETGNKETNNNSMSKKDFRFAYLIVMWAGETCIHPKSDEFVWALGVRKHTYHRRRSLHRPQITQRKCNRAPTEFDFALTAKRSSQCTGLHNLRCGHERRRVCGKTARSETNWSLPERTQKSLEFLFLFHLRWQ